MTSRTHTPEDIQKIIEPWRDSASDYERGFIDGMQKQMQSSVDKAVNRMTQPEHERFLVATIGNWGRVEWADGVFPSLGDKMYSAPRTWVGLTDEDEIDWDGGDLKSLINAVETKLKEKNT